MKCGYIYKITNPIGQVYIGQTTQYENRKRYYKNLRCKSQKRLYNSLMYYGFNSHKMEIIYKFNNSTKEELNRIEIFFIKFFNSFSYENKKYGLNLTEGGDIKSDHWKNNQSVKLKDIKFTEEHKKKIGDANRGKHRPKWLIDKLVEITKNRVVTEETRLKQSKAQKGKIISEKQRRQISIANTGRNKTEEEKQRISSSLKGIKWSKERNEKVSIANRGTRNPKATITEDQVYNIKDNINKKIKRGITLKEFGITNAIYDGIKYGKNWKHVIYPKAIEVA